MDHEEALVLEAARVSDLDAQAAELGLIELDSTTGGDELIEFDSTMGRELAHERTALLIDLARGSLQLAMGKEAELDAAAAKIQAFEVALARGMALAQTQPAAKSKPKRQTRARNPRLENLRMEVRKMHRQGRSQRDICMALDALEMPTPSTAEWHDLKWQDAYRHRKHGKSCRKWISQAHKPN